MDPLTTEQALRRLKLLGFTILDEPIKKSVGCMVACLNGERKIDNYHEKGIYYIYNKRISELPKEFQSIETSRYLETIDILSGYKLAKEKLGFVVKWLEDNKDENGQWDLGVKAKDNLYFPLSDSWRSAECRKADCTAKIAAIIDKLKS